MSQEITANTIKTLSARLDKERQQRCGFPEVVLGEFKSLAQLNEITEALLSQAEPVLVTRLQEEKAEELLKCFSSLEYDSVARCLYSPFPEASKKGRVDVICAGTSDLPVAREALLSLQFFGIETQLTCDVGVAGLHRLLDVLPEFSDAKCLIAIAGMEGALATVLGGLVDKPIIAVPTSVGYGSHQDGQVALLSMLNSCASGLSVVNIDNGFGAACAASRIIQQLQ